MKKVITVLITAILLFACTSPAFASSKFDEMTNSRLEKEANERYSVVEDDVVSEKGEEYNAIYKEGWKAGYRHSQDLNANSYQEGYSAAEAQFQAKCNSGYEKGYSEGDKKATSESTYTVILVAVIAGSLFVIMLIVFLICIKKT